MKNRPYFVIFGAMRTGSNLLERTLDGLGDTCCYGEAFNPGFISGPKTHSLFGWTVEDRDSDQKGFLTLLRGEAGGKIPGFRYFDRHAPDLLPRLARDPACRRIVLKRDPLASYLSLLAARETGQWLLRNAHRRKEVRVTFDAVEFEVYRERLAMHYAWFDAEMAKAGTDALRLDFNDLQEPLMLDRAAEHIGSTGTVPAEQPLVRQNPGRMADRVTNYAEMCAWLGLHPEPRTPPPLPVAEDVLVSRDAPLALAPLEGPGGDAALSLVYRIAARNYGGARLSLGQLRDPRARHPVFLCGLSGEVLQSELEQRQLIAMVCHPALRLHQLFLNELFGRDWHMSSIRRHLVRAHGGIPSPRELEEGRTGLDPARHEAIFLGFLDLVAASRDGEGAVPPARQWRSQADLLDRYQKIVRVDCVATLEDLPQAAVRLTSALGAKALPDKQVAAVLRGALRDDLPMHEVASDAVLETLRVHWGADFARFGYGDWPIGHETSAPRAREPVAAGRKFGTL